MLAKVEVTFQNELSHYERLFKIFGHQDTFDNWNTEKLKLLESGADARALKILHYIKASICL